MIFVYDLAVADLRHASEFIQFFCEPREPNEEHIRVSMESIQKVASRHKNHVQVVSPGTQLANKKIKFLQGRINQCRSFFGE